MATTRPTFDEFFRVVNQKAPGQYTLEELRADYKTTFDADPVFVAGPTLDQFRSTVETKAPGVYTPEEIEADYHNTFGAPWTTDLKRSANLAGAMQRLGMAGGLEATGHWPGTYLGGATGRGSLLDKYLPDVFRTGLADMATAAGVGAHLLGNAIYGKADEQQRQNIPATDIQQPIADVEGWRAKLAYGTRPDYLLSNALQGGASMPLQVATGLISPALGTALGTASEVLPSVADRAFGQNMGMGENVTRTGVEAAGMAALNRLELAPLLGKIPGATRLIPRLLAGGLGGLAGETVEEGWQKAAMEAQTPGQVPDLIAQGMREGSNVGPGAGLMGMLMAGLAGGGGPVARNAVQTERERILNAIDPNQGQGLGQPGAAPGGPQAAPTGDLASILAEPTLAQARFGLGQAPGLNPQDPAAFSQLGAGAVDFQTPEQMRRAEAAAAVDRQGPAPAQLDEMQAKLAEEERLADKFGVQEAPMAYPYQPAPVFYSGLQKLVDAAQAPRATGEQWASYLKNKGAKSEELAWTGADEWLREQKGAVTKDALAEYLKAHEVKVEEVVKGDRVYWNLVPAGGYTEEDIDVPIGPLPGGLFGSESEALRAREASPHKAVIRLERSGMGKATKFEQWQVPGGENYRELLLTLPTRPAGNTAEVLAYLYPGRTYDSLTALQRRQVDAYVKDESGATNSAFTSSHWDEPNVLAHVRFNDRTDADGKRVLFLEEVQSDWHQKGRKEGYKQSPALAEYDKLEAEHDLLRHIPRAQRTEEEQARYAELQHILSVGAGTRGVPDAPFKTTWPELMLKRMVRWAAENGYDRIAWTPGEVQADRYDLSKQVSRINVLSREDGTFNVVAFNGSAQLLRKDGLSASELEATIGKDLAKKSTEQPAPYAHSFTGPDLKVGGEGMRGFYDKILVDTANKLGKRFGAKVGRTQITGKNVEADVMNGEEAGTEADRLTVHSLDITPAMRDSVMRGQAIMEPRAQYGVGERATGYRAEVEGRQAGRLDEEGHAREKSSGRYIGAPDWVGNEPKKMASLRAKLRHLANEGKIGRWWYEKSARRILEITGGNKADAEKLIGLIAIYSQRNTVPGNTTMAIKAWNQWKAGEPITSSMFSEQIPKAEAWLNRGEDWGGVKTNNFYSDLMEEIDPSKVDFEHSTMDMWMALAFDYGKASLGGAQYAFAQREIARIAKDLGWRPHQVQAAIWTAIKARVEGSAKERNAWEDANGISVHDEKGRRSIPPDKKYEHFRAAHKFGMQLKISQAEIDATNLDYSDTLGERAATVSWEATPGESTGVLPGIHRAPYSQLVEYLSAMRAALTGPDGRDLIDARLGLLTTRGLEGASGWQGKLSASVQQQTEITQNDGKVDPLPKALVNLAADIRGLVLSQEAVAWHFPIYNGAKFGQNGVEVNVGRTLTESETEALYRDISKELGHSYAPPIPTDTGFRVLNFPDELRDLIGETDKATISKLQKVLREKNGAFYAAVLRAVHAQPWHGEVTEDTRFETDGDLRQNDWRKGDADYRGRIAAAVEGLRRAQGQHSGGAGLADLQAWIDGELRPRVEAVNRQFAARYGWDNATQGQVGERKSAYAGTKVKVDANTTQTLDVQTRPGTNAEQVRKGNAFIGSVLALRDRLAGASVLADALTRQWIDTGFIPVVGQIARSAGDLAYLGQVYRHPQVETLRLFAVKAGVIVGQTGLAQRLPGGVSFGPYDQRLEYYKQFLAAHEADGYYLFHNHPSGRATPSWADVDFTTKLARDIPGMLAHVIVDHNEYGVLESDGKTGTHRVTKRKFGGYDPKAEPRVPHDLLGTVITDPWKLGEISIQLPRPAGRGTVIATGADGSVRAIVEFPEDRLTWKNERQFWEVAARIRRLRASAGAGGRVFVVGPNPNIYRKGWQQGLWSDVVNFRGQTSGQDWAQHSPQIDQEASALEQGRAGVRDEARTAEEQQPYGPAEVPELLVDNPGGEWLANKRRRASEEGRNAHGAPRIFGTVTGSYDGPVYLPVSLLKTIRGVMGEQGQTRQDSLAWLTENMGKRGRLPPMRHVDEDYLPFITVDQDGVPWVNEGNHRIMAADKLGWKWLPVEIRYFNGGEREQGPLHPDRIRALNDARIAEDIAPYDQRPDMGARPTELGGGQYSNRVLGQLTPEEFRLYELVGSQLEPATEAQRRGTVPWSATESEALERLRTSTGIDLGRLINRKPGTAHNATQLMEFGMFLAKATQDVMEIGRKAASPQGTAEDLVRLKEARDRLALLVPPTMGAFTEAGRALNILRKAADTTKVAQALLAMEGRGEKGQLENFAASIAALGDPNEIISRTRLEYHPTLFDKAWEATLAAMLSGPWTHIRNNLGNLANLAAETLSAGVAAALPGSQVSAREFAARLGSAGMGWQLAMRNMREAWRTEEAQLNPLMKGEIPRQHAIGSVLGWENAGKVIRSPLRALLAEDEFWKGISYTMALHGLATRRAIADTPAGGDINATLAAILSNPTAYPQLLQEAQDEATRLTFQTPLGPIGQNVQATLRKAKFLKPIVPFVQTPTNILITANRYLPTSNEAWKSIYNRETGAGADMARARMALGMSIGFTVFAAVVSGLMTGAGPDDWRERALWQALGKIPYAIKVGDKWISYANLDPIGLQIGLFADVAQGYELLSDGEYEKAATLALMSLVSNLAEKTYLRGVMGFAEFLNNPQQAAGTWAGSMATMPMPAALSQTASALDPWQREARTILDKAKRKLPGLRETLARKVDVTGQPMPNNQFLGGISVTEQRSDPLVEAMLKLGIDKGRPGRKQFNTELTDEEYEQFASYVGQIREKQLTPMVSSPQFQLLMQQNPVQANLILTRRFDKVTEQARTVWAYQHPGVLARGRQEKRNKLIERATGGM